MQGHSLRLGTSSPSNAGKESVITVTVVVFILGARLSLRIHWQIGCIEIEVTSLTEGDHYIIICHCDPEAGPSKALAKFYLICQCTSLSLGGSDSDSELDGAFFNVLPVSGVAP
jgi:hypothetical protein